MSAAAAVVILALAVLVPLPATCTPSCTSAGASYPFLDLPWLGSGQSRVDGRERGRILSVWSNSSAATVLRDTAGRPFRVPAQLSAAVQSTTSEDSGYKVLDHTTWSTHQGSSYHSWSAFAGLVGISSTSLKGKLDVLLKQRGNIVAITQRKMSDFSGQAAPLAALADQHDSPFNRVARALPTTCTSARDKHAYNLFLNDYGTDYVDYVRSGLHVTFVVTFGSNLLAKFGTSWAMHQVSAFVAVHSIKLGLQSGSSLGKSQLSTKFTSNATIDHIWMGGNLSLYMSNKPEYYADTSRGVVIESHTTEIADLLPGGARRACMRAMAADYVNSKGRLSKAEEEVEGEQEEEEDSMDLPSSEPAPYVAMAEAFRSAPPAVEPSHKNPPTVHGVDGHRLGQGVSLLNLDRVRSQVYPIDTSSCSYTVKDPRGGRDSHGYARRVCVPDGVMFSKLGAVVDDTKTGVATSFSSYTSWLDKWMGISVGIGVGDLELSAAFGRQRSWYRSKTNSGKRGLGVTSRSVLMYDLDVYLSQGMSASAERFLHSLPAQASTACFKSNSCKQAYCRAFDLIGTHVITGVSMGGLSNSTVSFDLNYAKHHSSSKTSQQVSIGLTLARQAQLVTDFGWGKQVSHSQLEHAFGAHISTGTVGGRPDLMDTTGGKKANFKRWLSSVESKPTSLPLLSRYTPLFRLMPIAGGQDVTRKRTLRDATVKYLESGGKWCK